MTDTPFAAVYSSIWNLVDDSTVLSLGVRKGNRIRFDTNDRNPLKQNVQDADLPELMLISEGFSGNLNSSSSSTTIDERFAFYVSTGSFQYTDKLAPLNFELLRVLVRWKTISSTLLWKDKTFIKLVKLLDTGVGLFNEDQNRGLRGWSAIIRFQVTEHFKTSDLIGV